MLRSVLVGALASILLVVAGARAAVAPPAAAAAPWVALSDIHLGPYPKSDVPSDSGEDTNPALFQSLLAALKSRDPDPPVVIIGGDFLAHGFDRKNAAKTFVDLAAAFDTTYPHAQFLITLGNNDSPCGDYAAPIDGPFLAATAKAWEPLVNRHGAAPGFAKTFAHDGSYVAKLPVRGLRAVVVNDVSFSYRASGSCSNGKSATNLALADLASELGAAPPATKNWLLLHVPPGIDAYSTAYLAHRLAVIPFMRPRVREALDADIENPDNRVALVITGHTHKFAYRISSGPKRVPFLLVPSVSPIFANHPAFLELGVATTGTIGSVREIGLGDDGWKPVGDLASVGVRSFTVAQLSNLQQRIEKDAKVRDTFSNLYSGGGPPEWRDNWRVYWCSAMSFASAAFQECEDQHGFSLLRPRALKIVAAASAVAVAVCVLLFIALRSESKRKRSRRQAS